MKTMSQPYLLHMFEPGANVSPFDVNMAYDAGWDAVTPYTGVDQEAITGLVQDAIFSRSPKLGGRTGVFIGGKDVTLAKDMGEAAREALVPPFEVSIMVDPSGAFTTAAALIATVEDRLHRNGGFSLQGRRVVVLGGSGPVGSTAGLLATRAGGHVTLVGNRGFVKAQEVCQELERRDGVSLEPGDGSSEEKKEGLLAEAEVVLNCAAAGVQVLSKDQLARAPRLMVAADINAVPPPGLEGVSVQDNGEPLENSVSGAVGVGALTVGQLKSKVEHNLLERMRVAEGAVYYHYEQALEEALGQLE